MPDRRPARTSTRGVRIRKVRVTVVLAVVATIAAGLGHQLPRSSSSTSTAPSPAASSAPWSSATAAAPVAAPPGRHRPPPREAEGVVPDRARADGTRGPLGRADGVLPDGTTVLDGELPGVANLDADLLGALRRAAAAAADDGVELVVGSGWRSPAYQRRLLREAVSKHGAEEAARWVATPTTSAHVSGDAVDVGHADAAAWLSGHGAAYGLCQVYRNEPWHYELRPDAVDHGCPAMYADPTHDPRTRR